MPRPETYLSQASAQQKQDDQRYPKLEDRHADHGRHAKGQCPPKGDDANRTGDHDDRVFPAHSFKYAAAMQHAAPKGKPILIRIEIRAGHGQGTPTAKQINEAADVYTFILDAFGMTP